MPRLLACFVVLVCSPHLLAAPTSRPATQPVPAIQIIPQPYDQAAFTRDGVEIARYHFGQSLNRPFVFPLIGPSGRSLTRMAHPRDPNSHSHHNSVWVSHNDIDGVSFWNDQGKGRIIHQKIEAYEDEGRDESAAIHATNHWVRTDDNKVLMVERRRTQLTLLPDREMLMLIDLQFEAPPMATEPVKIGKTPFGLVGVRMAKTIGVHDGGGVLRNSEGGVGEKEIFWKPAKWCDYSGPITNQAIEGITLMDHPANPNHPTGFHVRSDGWMGTSLTLNDARTVEPGKPLRLRYGLYVHNGQPSVAELNKVWVDFGKGTLGDMTPKKR
jgi:hypothetical protein